MVSVLRRFPNAKREMPGPASHGDREIQPRRGPRIHHEVFEKFHAEMARSLKAKGRNSVGQIQVVVDGFWHVHDLQTPLRPRSNLSAENAVSSPPRVTRRVTPRLVRVDRTRSRCSGFLVDWPERCPNASRPENGCG